jgi:hypothetical protein
MASWGDRQPGLSPPPEVQAGVLLAGGDYASFVRSSLTGGSSVASLEIPSPSTSKEVSASPSVATLAKAAAPRVSAESFRERAQRATRWATACSPTVAQGLVARRLVAA